MTRFFTASTEARSDRASEAPPRLALCGEIARSLRCAVARRFGRHAAGHRTAGTRAAELRGVGIDQRLDQQVPLDLPFRDEAGETGDAAQPDARQAGDPVARLLPVPDALHAGAERLAERDAGAAVRRRQRVRRHHRQLRSDGHAASSPRRRRRRPTSSSTAARAPRRAGTSSPATRRRSSSSPTAVGFRYRYDPSAKEFAHAAGITVLTPRRGPRALLLRRRVRAARSQVRPDGGRRQKIGSPIDQLLLFCFHYDPSTGRYSSDVLTGVRIGGVLTVLALGGVHRLGAAPRPRARRAPTAPARRRPPRPAVRR